MIHVGSREYYEAVGALIAAHEARGGLVLYEGLGSLSEVEIAELTVQERAVYRALAPLHVLYRSLAGSLGLVFQGEALRYDRCHWIHADLPLRELVRRWAESGAPLLPFGVAGSPEPAMPEGRLARALGVLMLLQTPFLLTLLRSLRARIPTLSKLAQLLVSNRNRAALDAFDAADPSRDSLILYGAGHMPGIREGLERRGFSGVGERWLTAYVYVFPWARLVRSQPSRSGDMDRDPSPSTDGGRP